MANLKVSEDISSIAYGENIFAEVGMIMPYAGTNIPDGWLLCDGSTFSSTTYPRLYSLLGSSTTLPNLRQKYLLGYDSASPERSLASTVSQAHNHNVSYGTNNPTNGGAFSTTTSNFAHGHGINYNGIAGDGNGGHNHIQNAYGNTGGMTSLGNYSQAAPVNVGTATSNHTHYYNYGSGNYYSGGGVGHGHGINAVNTAPQTVGHAHNFSSSTNSTTLANSTSNTVPATVYINFIIKAG
jgi:microcystin-dependent protein